MNVYLAFLKYIGVQHSTHIHNPVTLSVGECIEFTARPWYNVVGNWTWFKDTILLATTSRVVINKGSLSISAVSAKDSAYYSAEFKTGKRKELFQFWLFVEGIQSLNFICCIYGKISDLVLALSPSCRQFPKRGINTDGTHWSYRFGIFIVFNLCSIYFKLFLTECKDYEEENPYFQGKCKSWCESKNERIVFATIA